MPEEIRFLIFDTETTGLPRYLGASPHDTDAWPRLVQIGWVLCNSDGEEVCEESLIIRPDGFVIPKNAERVHGISTEKALLSGISIKTALNRFRSATISCNVAVAHNMVFDEGVILAEYSRIGELSPFQDLECICTMEASVSICRIHRSKGWKYPKLTELYRTLFGSEYDGYHDALLDAKATAKCFFELRRKGAFAEPKKDRFLNI